MTEETQDKDLAPTTRELELELAVNEARANGLQHAANSLNAQAELLKRESAQVNADLARCREALKRRRGDGGVTPLGGGGPGEEGGTGP